MIGYRLQRTFLLGIRSLSLHKLRSVLTVLGIIFGVSSVIAMLSIGEGANFEAQEEIKKLGSHNIIIKSKKPSEEQASGYERSEVTIYGLKWEDFERIKASLPTARVLVPMRMVPCEGRYGQNAMDVQVVGTTPSYPEVTNARVARGRFITRSDMETLRPVCVLGSSAARQLFTAMDPIGSYVKLGMYYFRVVGIMEEKLQSRLAAGREAQFSCSHGPGR